MNVLRALSDALCHKDGEFDAAIAAAAKRERYAQEARAAAGAGVADSDEDDVEVQCSPAYKSRVYGTFGVLGLCIH